MCELRVCELRVWESASLEVCEFASLRVFEFASCESASLRVYVFIFIHKADHLISKNRIMDIQNSNYGYPKM